MWAPSKAGPEAQERLVSRPWFARQTSVLVPISRASTTPLGLAHIDGQQHGHMVGAYIAGDIGQQVQVAAGRDVQAHVPRLDVQGRPHGRHIGRQRQLLDRQTQEEVVHGGVADHHRFDNLRGWAPISAHISAAISFKGLDDQSLKLRGLTWRVLRRRPCGR